MKNDGGQKLVQNFALFALSSRAVKLGRNGRDVYEANISSSA